MIFGNVATINESVALTKSFWQFNDWNVYRMSHP